MLSFHFCTYCITTTNTNKDINIYTAAPKEHVEQITAFHHQDDSWKNVIKSEPDPTFDAGYVGDADLGDFLARPTKIHEIIWTVASGSFDTTIDPWSLFLNDASVKKRVENFKLLRGNIHIRITINGNPFLYGRAMASYTPRPNYDNFNTTTNGTIVTMQESMKPHIFIDPTSSEAGEMVLPFFCPDNWIELAGSTAEEMGRLRLRSFNNLLHANSATGTAQITVFAWMDNVKMAAPTNNDYGTYTAQSGCSHIETALVGLISALTLVLHAVIYYFRNHTLLPHPPDSAPTRMTAQSGDEYGTGIVSKPASIVARAAGMLSSIPVLEPYARATEIAAAGVGRFAHFFGFSRPTIVSDLVRVKPVTVGNLANTDAHEGVTKLTLDSKQELCVDPRTVGLGDTDEMTMKFIAGKECYLGTSTWTEANTDGTVLREMNVTPLQQNVVDTYIQFAPMATVALPFSHWRGTIKFRVQIVASQMHRGRLRLSYDPVFGTANPPYNDTYSRVIDLATNRDFTFEVGWNAHRTWQEVNDGSINPASGNINHDGGSTNATYHNGVVTLSVLNQLTSPDPSLGQSVYLNIYASAGDDFEVAGPTDGALNYFQYDSQSGVEYLAQSGEENEELIEETDNAPEDASPIAPIGDFDWMDAATHVYFGESFHSIRALLKRYCYHSTIGAQLGEARADCVWWREYNFPYYPGPMVRFARHGATSPVTTLNYGALTLLHWFTPCYAGWRGGLRSKYIPVADDNVLMVRRDRPRTTAAVTVQDFQYTTLGDENKMNDINLRLHRSGIGGMHIIKGSTDGGAEIEFPFYSFKRFAPARDEPSGTASNTRQGHVDMHVGTLFNTDQVQPGGVMRYVAAGDDYSLFFWLGQPILQYVSSDYGSGTTLTLPGK
jgi:hypothetical protein